MPLLLLSTKCVAWYKDQVIIFMCSSPVIFIDKPYFCQFRPTVLRFWVGIFNMLLQHITQNARVSQVHFVCFYRRDIFCFIKSWMSQWLISVDKILQAFFSIIMVLSCQNVIKFITVQIIRKMCYRKCIRMFRCYYTYTYGRPGQKFEVIGLSWSLPIYDTRLDGRIVFPR